MTGGRKRNQCKDLEISADKKESVISERKNEKSSSPVSSIGSLGIDLPQLSKGPGTNCQIQTLTSANKISSHSPNTTLSKNN